MGRKHTSLSVFFSSDIVVICLLIAGAFGITIACKQKNASNLSSASDQSMYSFGGACGSRGFWTQTAASRAQDLTKTINDLKNNKKCTKVYDKLKDIGDIKSSLTPPDDIGYRYSRMMTLTREITSVASYLDLTNFHRGNALALLLDRTFEQRKMQAEDAGEAGSAVTVTEKPDGTLDISRDAAASLQNRMSVSAQTGLDRMRRYFEALSESAECVSDNPALGGMAVVTQSSQILGAFASGDPATASRVGDTLNSFAKFLRDSKYSNAVTNMNGEVLANSISCLIETAQYSYCAARDAQAILESGGKRLESRIASGKLDKKSAFYSYYIMTYHLPVLTQWIQTVLGGYVPMRRADAKRLNGIFQLPTDTQSYRNEIDGIYNDWMRNILQATDQQSQAFNVLSMVKELNKSITHVIFPRRPIDHNRPAPTNRSLAKGQIPNFYLGSMKPYALPFRLVGIAPKDIPRQCVPGSRESAGVTTPFFTLRIGEPDFNDLLPPWNPSNPLDYDRIGWAEGTEKGLQDLFYRLEDDGHATDNQGKPKLTIQEVIRAQLDEMLLEGEAAANAYFWQNLPLDVKAVATDMGSGQISSAITSLRVIKSFLLDQMKEIDDAPLTAENAGFSGHMEVTYQRLEAVDKAYSMYLTNPQGEDAAKKFIKVVFQQFELVFHGASFLPKRMIGYVTRDLFNKITKQKIGVSSLEAEILSAARDLAYEQIVASMGTNSENLQSGKIQLASAQKVNMASLSALQTAFGDKLMAIISQTRGIALGHADTSDRSIRMDSYMRSRAATDKYIDRGLGMVLAPLGMAWIPEASVSFGPISFVRRSLNPDLYPMPNPWRGRGPGFRETQFGSFSKSWAELCMLTLAFPDPEKFAEVCDGAVLYSEWEDGQAKNSKPKKVGPLSISYNHWRKSFFANNGTPLQPNDPSQVAPSPVCAYYDSARRNLIYAMTLDNKRPGDQGVFIQAPSDADSAQSERAFVRGSAPPRDKSQIKAMVGRKIGKVPAETTFCNSDSSSMAPQICGAYADDLKRHGYGKTGSVAVMCYDLQGSIIYCCNGTDAAGQLPDSGDAPCYKSMTDKDSLAQILTDKDLTGPQ